MKRLETVSCSLNLGFVYNLDYSYSPDNGVSMTLFFVNERGEYNPPILLPMQKTNIRIGQASFSLYPKSYKISKAQGRRVISVDFVDEMFMLDNDPAEPVILIPHVPLATPLIEAIALVGETER